jgi:hypothetical protein
MFYLPRKKWFRPELDIAAMENLLDYSKWQLVQIGASAFELRFMAKNINTAIDIRGLRATLKKALGADITVGIIPVPALGPASSGKFLTTSNRFRN